MAKRVDGSLGTLLQGISQQPDKERLPGQVEDQVNMTSDPLRMLHRRPPTQFQAKLSAPAVDPSKIFTHFYSRGVNEEYLIMVYPNNGTPLILDPDGTEYTIDASASMQSYLSTDNPKKNLAATTVGDYTFLVNKTITVTETGSTPEEWSALNPSRVAVTAEQYSREYSVVVRGTDDTGTFEVSASYSTPESTATGAESDVSSNNTLQEIVTVLEGDARFTANFSTVVKGNECVFIPTGTLESYSIEATDTTGGDAMLVLNNREITSLDNLPVNEEAEAVYKVTGGTDDADDFYMRFKVTESATGADEYFQTGIWVETKYGDSVLDADNMPHLLIRGSTQDFAGGAAGETVDSVELDAWAERLVGDDTSNPEPPFVGQKIVDVAVFQDRLVLVHPEGVTMSVTRDFFNFYKKTVTTLLNDAPIGLSSAGVRINLMRFAQIQDRDLVIFADRAQYSIPGRVAITPQNATMTETTQFVMQTEVRPAASGQNLFFAVNSGVYSGVREFYTDSDLNSNNARPITVAVEKLISGTIRLMESSTNISKMLCMGSEPSTAYVYEYLWEDTERLQSAWSKWKFRDDLYVFHLQFSQDDLLVLSYDENSSEIHLCRMDISQDTTQTFFEGDILLDHRTSIASVNTEITGLDHLPDDIEDILAVQGPGCPYPGMRIKISDWDGSTATLKSDMLGGTVYVGAKYKSSVTPSRVYVKDDNNRAITTSQLTLGAMFINFIDSGDFNVEVIADYTYTARNPGRTLGQPSSTVGDFILTSGSFEVPVRARNDRSRIEVSTDSPYPFTVSDIEWDGQFYKRGTRITMPGG